ncbi:MAG: hypothetical protein LBR91_00280 [Puniceicoccales bacterium]|nr:hypothetical protein [Puniceicoccales bacterium]
MYHGMDIVNFQMQKIMVSVFGYVHGFAKNHHNNGKFSLHNNQLRARFSEKELIFFIKQTKIHSCHARVAEW